MNRTLPGGAEGEDPLTHRRLPYRSRVLRITLIAVSCVLGGACSEGLKTFGAGAMAQSQPPVGHGFAAASFLAVERPGRRGCQRGRGGSASEWC